MSPPNEKQNDGVKFQLSRDGLLNRTGKDGGRAEEDSISTLPPKPPFSASSRLQRGLVMAPRAAGSAERDP